MTLSLRNTDLFQSFLIPPVGFSDLLGPMLGVQSGLIDNRNHLDSLFNRLSKIEGFDGKIVDWNKYTAKFLDEVGLPVRRRLLGAETLKIEKLHVVFDRAEMDGVNYKLKLRVVFVNKTDHKLSGSRNLLGRLLEPTRYIAFLTNGRQFNWNVSITRRKSGTVRPTK